MNLTLDDWNLLQNYVGEGPIDKAKIVFFGNEFGLAQNNIENYLNFLKTFIKENKIILLGKDISEGFTIYGKNSAPLNSQFVRFCSRFMLAFNNKDDRFLGELSKQGEIAINNYITHYLHMHNSAIINYRALPRPSEDQWIYENINKNNYLKSYSISSKNHVFDKSVKHRISNLLRAFYKASKPIIIGTGDKWNKQKLFERLLKHSKFKEIQLTTGKNILIDENQKIILTDYFDHRTLGLNSLKEIFNIIKYKYLN